MERAKRVRVGLLGIVISGLAIAFIASQIQLEAFGQALLDADYAYVLPCLLFLLLGLVARALRWRALLAERLPLLRVFSIMNVAYLVNGVLPLRLGEVARVFLMSQVEDGKVRPMRVISSIVVERLLDLLAVVLMVLVGLAFAPVPDELRAAGGVGAVMVTVGFCGLIVAAANRRWLHRLHDRLSRGVPPLGQERLRVWLDQFLDGIAPLTQWRSALRLVGWTALSWSLSIIAGYFLMVAVFGAGDWLATALYIAAAAFAIAVPAVPGNLGTYEWSIVVALQALGYGDFSRLAAFALLVHAVNVLVHAATGVVGMFQEGVTLGQLQRGVRQMRGAKGEYAG
ncbi:MAG: lysylphosphatidylglycerol synthase transmembrane domain-containing protein [Anaerolineae bacterium]